MDEYQKAQKATQQAIRKYGLNQAIENHLIEYAYNELDLERMTIASAAWSIAEFANSTYDLGLERKLYQ